MFKFKFGGVDSLLDIEKNCLQIGNETIMLKSSPVERKKKIYYKITDDCNLNCIYCFQKHENKQHNNIEIKRYKQVIEQFINDTDKEIIIFGGEPLLDSNKEKLEFILNILEEDKQVSFFTNGCYSNDVYDLIKRNASHIGCLCISIDGPESIHNARRTSKICNTYRSIINNTLKLIEDKIPFIFQINIDKANMNMIEELLLDLDSTFGLENIKITFNRVLREKETITEKELIQVFHWLFKKYPDANLELNSVVYRKLTTFISNEGYDRERCGIGKNDIVFDLSTKEIYSCPQSVDTKIGCFNEAKVQLNQEEQDKMYSISYKNNEQCNKCNYVNFCSYGCFLENIDSEKNCKRSTYEAIEYIFQNFDDFFMSEEEV